MQTLENLERKFLSIIPTKPFELGDVRATTDSDKQLTVEQAKQDIAVLAQMLINAYGGWPFYPKLLRLRILNKLNRIYDKITQPITASELFAQLKPIIEIMPDNHLWIKLGDNLAKYPRKPRDAHRIDYYNAEYGMIGTQLMKFVEDNYLNDNEIGVELYKKFATEQSSYYMHDTVAAALRYNIKYDTKD